MPKAECKRCRWKKECVNVGKFADGDCLQYKLDRRKKK